MLELTHARVQRSIAKAQNYVRWNARCALTLPQLSSVTRDQDGLRAHIVECSVLLYNQPVLRRIFLLATLSENLSHLADSPNVQQILKDCVLILSQRF